MSKISTNPVNTTVGLIEMFSNEYWGTIKEYVELLIRLVRDEEYELHLISTCAYKDQKKNCVGGKWDRCEGCPADGTRYCP